MTVAVGIVGFGRIGRIHAQALGLVDGVRLAAVADPAADAGAVDVPAFPSADEMVDAGGLDAVIVATPTWTHAEVVSALRRRWRGRLVLEKPAATTAGDVDALLAEPPVDLVYHAAFAPEVEWAAAQLPRWCAAHGGLRSVVMAFADACAVDLERATETLGDSWLDGGINALSVLAQVADPVACTSRRRLGGAASTVEATVAFEGESGSGAAVIVTTWAAAEPSKSSRLVFADGAVAVLDHQAVVGRLEVDGRVAEWFDSGSIRPRLVQHYVGCFTRLFVEGRRCFPVAVDRRLHRLLLEEPG